MKKHLLGLALVSALGLTACGDGPKEPEIPSGASEGNVTYTKPLYSPATGKLPAPNDILFSGTTDLTLRQSGVTSDREGSSFPANEVYVDPNPLSSNASVAASHVFALDGWSIVAPFVINFTNVDPSVKIDPTSLVGGQTVRVFRVNTARPAAANGVVPPTGPVVGIQSELQVGVDYRIDMVSATEQAGRTDGPSGTMRITPINPVAENGSYLVVLTNGIKDARGLNIIADSQFEVLKGRNPIASSSSLFALEPLRQVLNPAFAALEADKGLARENVTLAMQFNVQGVGDVLSTVMQVVNNPQAPAAATSGFAPKAPFSALNAALTSGAVLWQGNVRLPYYLSAPSATEPLAPLKQFWRADAASPLGTNLTYVNKLPKKTGDETVPMLLAVPGASATGSCVKPSAGWPVVIFQHGITRNRTDMLPIANTLASFPLCHATVAIDLPLHGLLAAADYSDSTNQGLATLLHTGYTPGGMRERIFGVDYVNNTTGASGPDGKVDSSGQHFINLTSPLTSRDNLRQAGADLLALSRALTVMDFDGVVGADFDPARIHFVGLSLGAITGANFVAYDPRVKTAVLVAPGGGLAKMVPSSPAFGPTINAGLAAAGRATGSAGYEDFLFLLQTVIDQGDPLGNWEAFRARTAKALMVQMGGDLVVPNDVTNLQYMVFNASMQPVPSGSPARAPYAGTTPLARAFGLSNIGASTQSANGVSGFIRFAKGCHGSLLSPATCAPVVTDATEAGRITIELNKMIAQYIGANGNAVQFTDTALYVP